MKLYILLSIMFFSITTFGKNYLVIGEFPLKKVVDGDTIHAEGLDASIRILFIDTEETHKGKNAYKRVKNDVANWDDIVQSKIYKTVDKPIKYNTPNGYQAWQWAKEFFKDVSIVRLEYDDIKNKKGFYDRYLAYVFAKKNNKWVNYNIEVIKHGYSPYSTKYGRSIRFHKEFVEAQKFAKSKKLGIWKEGGKHYPDYEARLKWWDKRGEQIHEYRTKHQNEYLFIGGIRADYWKLKKYIGKKAKLFGLMRDIAEESDEFTFTLPVKQFINMTVHVSKRAGYGFKDLKKFEDYYVYVKGELKRDQDNKYHIYVKKQSDLIMK